MEGSCHCRAATFTVVQPFAYAMNCHCNGCRRTTGAAFKPMGGVALEAVRLGADAPILRYGAGTDHDLHCATCGSLLYSVVRDGSYAHVPLGVMTDDPGIRPASHIMVAYKAPWFEITDDLPQHDEFPE